MVWKNSHLPLPTGPFVPGCVDFMDDYSKDSCFARVYYPTTHNKNDDSLKNKWFTWTPHAKYIDGFAKVINSWPSVIRCVVWLKGGEPLVPAVWEGTPHLPDRLPVILYSHGFGASRFICATIGAEFASRGFLFVAIEHKDTSASATYYYDSPEAQSANNATWIPHTKIEFGPNHYPVRNKQLHERASEMKRLFSCVEKINAGEFKNILPSNIDLNQYQGRLDMDHIVMMGHSFGGATTLLSMIGDERISCGVILDGWMFPLKEEQNLQIKKPLLFINTHTFHIPSNLIVMDKFINAKEDGVRDVYTMKRTTHENQTDGPFIWGYWLNWWMNKLDPVVATNINNYLSVCFLQKHIGYPTDVDEIDSYLKDHADDIASGTLLHSKYAKRSSEVGSSNGAIENLHKPKL